MKSAYVGVYQLLNWKMHGETLKKKIYSKIVSFINETGNVLRNTDARLCNYCCSGKAISMIHSECVFVALGPIHTIRHVSVPSRNVTVQ